MTPQPAFIDKLFQDVQKLSDGPTLLELLNDHDVSVAPMPPDGIDAYSDDSDIACLHITDTHTTLYLTDNCAADDFVHELSHIHHLFGLPENFTNPTDIKHRYIAKAFREADAFARQMSAFLESLQDPEFLKREMEFFEQVQAPHHDPDIEVEFTTGPVRLLLYMSLKTPPDEILGMLQSGEITINDAMRDFFCTVLHDYIPEQYTEGHLSELGAQIQDANNGADTFEARQAPIQDHTEDDILFFANCLREYGSWGREANYLVSPEGYGPDSQIFLNGLFSPDVCGMIQDLNSTLQKGQHYSAPQNIAPQILPDEHTCESTIMRNKEQFSISELKEKIMQLSNAANLQDLLLQTEVPIQDMPEAFAKEYPDSPMMLYLNSETGRGTIFAQTSAQPEELVHEIAHTRHFCGPFSELRDVSDIKHAYIFFAMAEADAYAHQAACLLERLTDPEYDIQTEKIEALASKQNPAALWEPVRYCLYTLLDLDPEKMSQNPPNEQQRTEIMFHVFSWTLQNFVPAQYEERHLDAVYATTQENQHQSKTGKATITQRSETMSVITQSDYEYFHACIESFGVPISSAAQNYLITAEGYGPDPDIYMKALFTQNALTELAHMNHDLPQENLGMELGTNHDGKAPL